MSNGHGGAIHTMPASDLAQWLIGHNEAQSREFCSPDAKGRRAKYRGKHPTEILALKCMDGRLHVALMAETPFGIIQPMRNLGGRFDLGWPLMGEVVTDWVRYAVSHGRDCLILVTYHWSKGNKHRGCRGFHYEVDEARAFAFALAKQIAQVYGLQREVVFPVCLGVETDEDAFVFHGTNGHALDVATLRDPDKEAVRAELAALYPDMNEQMVNDLLPLVLGNARHVSKVRASARPVLDIEHRERVLGIGRGFDWLDTANLALLVGPFDPNLDAAIETAARLLWDNILEGRVPDDGAVLLASAPFRDSDQAQYVFDKARATEKVRFLRRFALDVIGKAVPRLREVIIPVAGVVDINTRKLHLLED